VDYDRQSIKKDEEEGEEGRRQRINGKREK
jgi:hypothetical protein